MVTSLKKGETLTLQHGVHDLSRLTISLRWDPDGQLPAEIPTIHIGTRPQPQEFDLDVIALLLQQNGRLADLGNQELKGGGRSFGDVVYHRVRRHSSGAIWLNTDNRQGAGEEEQIVVLLQQLDAAYQRIVFMVMINEGRHRGQNFAQVGNARVRVQDGREQEICLYDISHEPAFGNACALTVAEVRREGEHWLFQALGQPHTSDRFSELLKPYL